VHLVPVSGACVIDFIQLRVADCVGLKSLTDTAILTLYELHHRLDSNISSPEIGSGRVEKW